MTFWRLVFDLVWLGALVVLLLRLRDSLVPKAYRSSLLIASEYLLGQILLWRATNDSDVPMDVSMGVAVLSMAVVTRFNLASLTPASLRRDGKDGAFVRHPVPHTAALVVIVGMCFVGMDLVS